MCVVRAIGTSDLSFMLMVDQSRFHDQDRGVGQRLRTAASSTTNAERYVISYMGYYGLKD